MKPLAYFGLALLITTSLSAEQRLIKNSGSYLGFKQSADSFVTCHGGHVSIGNGHVANTDDQCSEGVIGPITGSVAAFDGETLTVRDSYGNEITFTLTKQEVDELGRIKSGSSIRVTPDGAHGRRFHVTKSGDGEVINPVLGGA